MLKSLKAAQTHDIFNAIIWQKIKFNKMAIGFTKKTIILIHCYLTLYLQSFIFTGNCISNEFKPWSIKNYSIGLFHQNKEMKNCCKSINSILVVVIINGFGGR